MKKLQAFMLMVVLLVDYQKLVAQSLLKNLKKY